MSCDVKHFSLGADFVSCMHSLNNLEPLSEFNFQLPLSQPRPISFRGYTFLWFDF